MPDLHTVCISWPPSVNRAVICYHRYGAASMPWLFFCFFPRLCYLIIRSVKCLCEKCTKDERPCETATRRTVKSVNCVMWVLCCKPATYRLQPAAELGYEAIMQIQMSALQFASLNIKLTNTDFFYLNNMLPRFLCVSLFKAKAIYGVKVKF